MLDAVLAMLGFEGPLALISIFAGAAVVMIGTWIKGRRAGINKAQERDNARSKAIEEAADAARAADVADERPAVERLRDAGRLR